MNPRILIVVALLTICGAAHAQTWDGGGANGGNLNWNFASNWDPNGVPLNNGSANIVFGGLFDINPGPNLDQNWSINSVTFDNAAGAFTLGSSGGFTLTVAGGGIVNQDAQTQTINHAITLAATQTWSATSGGLNFSSGTIGTNGNALTLDGAGSLIVIDGAITGSGSVTITGSQGATFSSAVGSNTYTALTTVGGSATLHLSKFGGATAIAGNLTIGQDDGGAPAGVRLSGSDQIANSSTVTVLSDGLFDIASAASATISAPLSLGGGTCTFAIADGAAANDMIIAGAVSAGSFDRATPPERAGDLAWKDAQLHSTSQFRVVPEPGIGVLLAGGLVLFGLRRKQTDLFLQTKRQLPLLP